MADFFIGKMLRIEPGIVALHSVVLLLSYQLSLFSVQGDVYTFPRLGRTIQAIAK
jgi:hypothetical protein